MELLSRFKRGAASVVAAGLASAGLGSTLASAETAPSGPTIVLKAAHLFDSVSGKLRSDGVIVVRGDKVSAVGTSAQVSAEQIPADARVIDLGNATLLPGFIDAHVHIAYEFDDDYYRHQWNLLTRFTSEQALWASTYARRTLEAGFTTIRNVGATGEFIDVGIRNAINAGIIAGPRILTAVHAISSTGGSCDQWPYPPDRIPERSPLDGTCNGTDQCRQAVREQIKFGADVIKICVSGGVLSADPVDVPQFTADEVNAMIDEAHSWKRKVAAHAHGDVAARQAVEAGVDSIEHGSFLSEDTLRLMKRKGTFFVPTRMALYWVEKNADNYPPIIAQKARVAAASHGKAFQAALKLGVPIALGTDQTVMPHGHGKNALEFGLMTALGMTPEASLLAGTREGAKLLGVDAEVGTLEPGKWADIVAVPGDVVADIHATERPLFVMQKGHVIRGPNP